MTDTQAAGFAFHRHMGGEVCLLGDSDRIMSCLCPCGACKCCRLLLLDFLIIKVHCFSLKLNWMEGPRVHTGDRLEVAFKVG